MPTAENPDIRATLRRALEAGMVGRDTAAVAVLRVAIAAIENSEAQPVGATTATELRLGGSSSSEVPRRAVSDDDARSIVAAEVDELLAAARHYRSLGEAERSATVEHQAAVLRSFLVPEEEVARRAP